MAFHAHSWAAVLAGQTEKMRLSDAQAALDSAHFPNF